MQAAAMLEAHKGNADGGPPTVPPSIPSAGIQPHHAPVPAVSAAEQQVSAESCSFHVHQQPSGKSAVSPPFANQSRASVRPPLASVPQLAVQQTLPCPAHPPISAQPDHSSILHAAHAGGSVGAPQPFPPSTVLGDSAMHRSPGAVSPAVYSQSSPARDGIASPGLSQSSSCPGPPVSFPPSLLLSPTRDASSSAHASAAPHVDLAGKDDPAAQDTPGLAAQEQMRPGMPHGAQAPGEVSSSMPVPPGVSPMQHSPPLGFLSIGSTPAAQTIQGMCSVGTSMPPQLSPAPPPFMQGASDALLGGQQRHDSPGTAGSPVMEGSLGIGTTPAMHTIRALEATGQKLAPPQSKPWQVGPHSSSTSTASLLQQETMHALEAVQLLHW